MLISAFSEFEAIKQDIARYMRLDVALGIEQGRFSEPLDEFVIDSHLALLRAGVSARLAGAGQDVSKRAAEYQLRILGMSAEAARHVLSTNELRALEPVDPPANPRARPNPTRSAQEARRGVRRNP
jgi:hypothetical protein